MKNNRPTKWKERQQFRVLTFDEFQDKNPSLIEYIKSLKTWFHKTLSDTPKRNVATSTRAARKSRSSSITALKSKSNNVIKKYTRSRSLSLEDLKRLFVIKKVFSSDKLQANQLNSKKRNLRTKVKNGEEYLNKWDREVKVLYSNETNNKACQPDSRHSISPSRTDGELPISSISTFGSSHKMGLIITSGKKECDAIPNRKDYRGMSDHRSKYCTSNRIRPYHEERFLGEDRHDSANQYRDAKVLVNRACSAMASCFCRPRRKEPAHKINKVCTCCLPYFAIRKSIVPYTDYANYQKSNKMCTCCCSKRKETSPKIDNDLPTHMYNNIKKRTKPADLKTDHAKTQTCNTICVKCSNQKQVSPKTNYADTQTLNNEDICNRSKTDYAKTQTSNEICILCYCPIKKTVNLKTGYANTQTSNNENICKRRKTDYANTQTSNNENICKRRKTDYANTQTSNNENICNGRETDYTKTQTSNEICILCYCPIEKTVNPKTDYANTQTSHNEFTYCCPKRKENVSKYNHGTQTFIDLFTWGCSKQNDLESEFAYAYTQTSNNLFTHKNPRKKTLRAYFSKLRRRNIRRQTCQKAFMRRLENVNKKSAIASTTTADEMFGSQSTSQARCKAALAVKHCPRGKIPVFSDSLCTKDTSSQTQFEGGNEPQTSHSAQTSELNPSPRVCTCLQKIVKRLDVTPDQRKQYILYHNSARGWLVKPLRTRQFSCLDDKLSPSKKQGQKPNDIDRSTCAHKEMHNKPAGSHNGRSFSKNPNERISCLACECNLSRNIRVRNSSRNKLCRNFYENSENIHEHNSSTISRECQFSPDSHKHSLSRKVYEKNSPKMKKVHIRDRSKRFRVMKSTQKPLSSSKWNTKAKKKSSLKKRRRKKSYESQVGCEWFYYSTPRCVFLEWCSGCKKCCKLMVIVFTAVLLCPIWGLMFLLHDFFCSCL